MTSALSVQGSAPCLLTTLASLRQTWRNAPRRGATVERPRMRKASDICPKKMETYAYQEISKHLRSPLTATMFVKRAALLIEGCHTSDCNSRQEACPPSVLDSQEGANNSKLLANLYKETNAPEQDCNNYRAKQAWQSLVSGRVVRKYLKSSCEHL